MAWRLSSREFAAGKSGGNRSALAKLLKQDIPPGLIAYEVKGEDRVPVGWCAIAPREEFVTLSRSRVWAPVDEKPVWSVTCFFVAKTHRNCGLTVKLLKAAVRFAAEHGARIVEGYPIDPNGRTQPAVFVWTGLASSYEKAGFREVARRSKAKPIFRAFPRKPR